MKLRTNPMISAVLVSILIAVVCVAVFSFLLRGWEPPNPDNNIETGIMIDSFLSMSRNHTTCSDIRNDLYVIDNTTVFWVTEGNCADARYSFTLFGATPQDILCSLSDSIAGPRANYYNESYRDLFDILTTHSTDADLGLGSSHHVIKVKV
jgi:hypothetical protein